MKESTLQKPVRYVGIKENLIFGIANAGQVFSNNMFAGTFLSIFFVKVFGIPSEAVATMVLILGIWDTVNDPLMGAVVDKTRTRYGKLRPYLLLVPLPLSVATILFWSGPLLLQNTKEMTLKIVYMYASYLIWEFFYTLGDVPFWSLSAAISPTPSDRARAITSARVISGVLGGVSTIVMLPVLMDLSTKGRISMNLKDVFALCGLISGIVLLALFSLAGFFVKERVVQEVEQIGFLDCFRYMFKNKPLFMIILSSFLSTFTAIGGVISGYFFVEVLEAMSWSTVITLLGGIGAAIGFVTMALARRRLGNLKIMIYNTLITSVTGIIAFLIAYKNYETWYIVIPVLTGRNIVSNIFGTYNSVASTEVIADCVDYMEWKTGVRNEGMAFSTLTFLGKLSGRVSTAISTAILPVIGYIVTEYTDADGMVQTTAICTEAFGKPTEFWLWAFSTIIPGVLGLTAIIPLFFYELHGKRLEIIRRELSERRHEIAQKMNGGGKENG